MGAIPYAGIMMTEQSEKEREIRRKMADARRELDQPKYEMVYATLYQQLVAMGVAPQLRKKHRP